MDLRSAALPKLLLVRRGAVTLGSQIILWFQAIPRNLRGALPALCWSLLMNTLLTAGILLADAAPTLPLEPVTILRTLAFALILTLIPHALLYTPLALVPPLRPRVWLLVGEALRLTLLLVDWRVFTQLGIHLDDTTLWKAMGEAHFAKDVGMTPLWLTILLGGLALVLLLEAGLARLRPRRLTWKPLGLATALWVPLLLTAHLTTPPAHRPDFQGLWPLYVKLQRAEPGKPLDVKAHLLARRKATKYPLHPMAKQDLTAVKRPDVVILLAETFRADMLNPVDMPNLATLAEAEPTLQSEHHFSGGHQTWEGTFSLIYALGGWQHDTFRDQPWKSQPIEMFRQLGYETVAVTSGSLKHIGYDAMLGSFDIHHDFNMLDAEEGDVKATDKVLELFAQKRELAAEKRKPLMVLVFYNATHYPFVYPPELEVQKPVSEKNASPMVEDAPYRLGLWNRYRNSVRFVDAEARRLLNGLQPERKAQQLAWVFTGDHGEEFWDLGQFGHASRRVNNARLQVPLILAFPGMTKQHVALSAHMDVFPTLFALMGIKRAPDEYADGQSLLGKPRTFVELNAYNFPEWDQFAVLNGEFKAFLRRSSRFAPEIVDVLDSQDRPRKWDKPDVLPMVQQFLATLDHFQPGYQLFRGAQVTFHSLGAGVLPVALGPLRTAQNPETLPWQRMQNMGDYVTTKKPPIQRELGIPFGQFAVLEGVNLPRAQVAAGDPIRIEYIFHVVGQPPADLKYFVHLDAPSPPGWQNLGHVPVFESLPVSAWKKGQYIRDVQEITTGTDWKPGVAKFRVGFYDAKDEKRVAVPKKFGEDNGPLVAVVQILPPR